MNVKLTKEEADKLRLKKVMLSYHSSMRWMYRLNFRKIEDVIQIGEIFQEGKNKFRAVLPIKRQRIAYAIFVDCEDYIYVKTVGVARK
jgi:predicted small integral membrane protein